MTNEFDRADDTAFEAAALSLEIVCAYLNSAGAVSLPSHQVPQFVRDIHAVALEMLSAPAVVEPIAKTAPAVPVERSVTHDAVICLHCGRAGKSLKRHIGLAHGQTPEQYIAYWGLSADYPLTAPSYSERRSELAKASGLGRKA